MLDTVSDFQDLCSCHPYFFLRQSIQPAQRILYISPSDQFLEIPLWVSINDEKYVTRDLLTRSSLLYLLRHNSKNSQYLYHDLYDDVIHRVCRGHLSIFLEPFEEVLNALEDIYERILARADILCRLCNFDIRTVRIMEI